MIDPATEELVSAYLDGELSASEQQRAARLLETDAEARALHDELVSIRNSLQALPRYQVRGDLAGNVLKAAEQAMLAAPPTKTPTIVRSSEQVQNQLPAAARTWRTLAILSMATAASLLFVIIFRAPESEDRLVKNMAAPESPIAATHPESADVPTVAPSESHPAADQFIPFHAEPAAPLAQEVAPLAAPDPAAFSAPQAGGAKQLPGATAGMDAAGAAPSMERGFAPGVMQGFAGNGGRFAPPVPSDALVVVQVDVTSAAVKSKAFEQLLARHNISWEDEGEEGSRQKDQSQLEMKDQPPARQQAAQEEGLEMVYLEAEPQQIEAALADLAADWEHFPGLAMTSSVMRPSSLMAMEAVPGAPPAQGAAGRAAKENAVERDRRERSADEEAPQAESQDFMFAEAKARRFRVPTESVKAEPLLAESRMLAKRRIVSPAEVAPSMETGKPSPDDQAKGKVLAPQGTPVDNALEKPAASAEADGEAGDAALQSQPAQEEAHFAEAGSAPPARVLFIFRVVDHPQPPTVTEPASPQPAPE